MTPKIKNSTSKNIVLDKSYAFALQIIELYKHLTQEKKEYILSKQLLRSGTSIGANTTEAQAAISKKLHSQIINRIKRSKRVRILVKTASR